VDVNERIPTRPAEASVAVIRSPTRNEEAMADIIYLAVVVLFFAASGRYASWCEKL